MCTIVRGLHFKLDIIEVISRVPLFLFSHFSLMSLGDSESGHWSECGAALGEENISGVWSIYQEKLNVETTIMEPSYIMPTIKLYSVYMKCKIMVTMMIDTLLRFDNCNEQA